MAKFQKMRSIYCDDDRWNRLKQLAAADGRSLNNYVTEVMINNHIESENEKNVEKREEKAKS